MEFEQVVAARRMVRRFDPDAEVPAATLRRVLRNATRAPSAGFTQGWEFLVLEGRECAPFWSATAEAGEPDAWLRGVRAAPVLILCLADPGAYLDRYARPDKGWTDRDPARWPVPYWDLDTGMAALLMLLTAVDEGLGGLFFGVPADRLAAVHESLGVPADLRVVGVVALGYPAPGAARARPGGVHRPRRRRPEEVVHRGRFEARDRPES